MGFSREENWSGSPCPPPGNSPNPGIKLTSLVSPALAGTTLEAQRTVIGGFFLIYLFTLLPVMGRWSDSSGFAMIFLSFFFLVRK